MKNNFLSVTIEFPINSPSNQIYLKRYLSCVRGIDDSIKRLLDYLDESGLAENTLVIYTSDQGFFLGEHGLSNKRFMYEESLRMPLLMRWPGKIKPGSINEDIVLNVDFAPTMLDVARSNPSPKMQGASMLPILMGESLKDWRQSMYYRYYLNSRGHPAAHFGLRTKRHKLICFQNVPKEGSNASTII